MKKSVRNYIIKLRKANNLKISVISKLKKKLPNLGLVLKRKQQQKETVLSKLDFEKGFLKRGFGFTRKMRRSLRMYRKHASKKNLKIKITRRLNKMKKLFVSHFLPRNLRKRTYFFKILRRAIRKKSRLKRSLAKKPIFSKKTKIDNKFFFRARNSLILTKKFLYKKQFPKIKGKKNKNFNFMYFNNMDKLPLKFNIGRIVITYLHNNTFMNIHDSKKMLKVFSAGKLGFKGPKRSTPYSRQVVARKVVKYLLKSKINILDIFLNSNYNRWYYFMFKEFSKTKFKPYAIRYLVSNNSRSHGFMRDKKQRRK